MLLAGACLACLSGETSQIAGYSLVCQTALSACSRVAGVSVSAIILQKCDALRNVQQNARLSHLRCFVPLPCNSCWCLPQQLSEYRGREVDGVWSNLWQLAEIWGGLCIWPVWWRHTVACADSCL